MGKSILEPSWDKKFGAKLHSQVIESMQDDEKLAKRMDVCSRTLRSRYKNPAQMTLRELKLFIKATGLPRESVMNYLYEGK